MHAAGNSRLLWGMNMLRRADFGGSSLILPAIKGSRKVSFGEAMGIAWFDDEVGDMQSPQLRTGGFPLLPADLSWPECSRCEMPMLFRAQIPLSVTSLVGVGDEALLQVFECHHVCEGEPCGESTVHWVQGESLALREPPAARHCDVWLHSLGELRDRVVTLARTLNEELQDWSPQRADVGDVCVLRAAPRSIAEQTYQAFSELGARVTLSSGAKTTLPHAFGARLMPFEDGHVGVSKTTLPPLHDLIDDAERTTMRGLLGGSTPGYRDHALQCEACGKPTRTAVRLLGQRAKEPAAISLDPALLQVCLSCRFARLFRTHSSTLSQKIA